MVRAVALFDFLQHNGNLNTDYVLRNEFNKLYQYVIAFIVITITFLLGIIGNFTMIIVSTKLARKRKTIPNKLIVYLSVADLFSLFAVYLPTVLAYTFGRYIGGNLLCNIHASSILFFHNLSILIMLAIAYDRYIAVSLPYYYQENMVFTQTKSIMFILLCCIISSLVSIPPLIGLGPNRVIYPGSFCFFDINDKNAIVLYLVIIGIYVVVMAVGCIGAVISVNRMLAFRRDVSAASPSCNNKEEKMFIRLSLLTIFVFIFIWTPIIVLFAVKLTSYALPDWYVALSFRIAALHAVINPWLYPLLRRKFRNSFGSLLKRTLCCFTCGCISMPKESLDEILNEVTMVDRRNTAGKTSTKKEKNTQTIQDYVDAPNKTENNSHRESKKEKHEQHDIEMQSIPIEENTRVLDNDNISQGKR